MINWLKEYWASCHPHEHNFKQIESKTDFETSVLTGVPVQVGWTKTSQCKCGEKKIETHRGTGASGQQDQWIATLKSGVPMIWGGYKVTWDHHLDKPHYELMDKTKDTGDV